MVVNSFGGDTSFGTGHTHSFIVDVDTGKVTGDTSTNAGHHHQIDADLAAVMQTERAGGHVHKFQVDIGENQGQGITGLQSRAVRKRLLRR